MKDYSALKREIQTYIRTNNNQEITGEVLQNVLVSIVSNVGENAGFGGIAKKTTSPGTPDGPVLYFATEQGVYPNFGGLEIERENTLNIIYNTEEGWDTLFLGNLVPSEEVEDFRTFKHLENMRFEEASEYCATFDNIIEKIGGGAIRFSRPIIFTFSSLGTEQGMIINSPSSNTMITQYAFTKGNVNSGFSHRLIQYDLASLTITNVGEWKPISSLIPAATTSAAGLMSAGDKVKLGNSVNNVSGSFWDGTLALSVQRNNGSSTLNALPLAKSEVDTPLPNPGIMSVADKEVLGNTGDINVGSLPDNGIDAYTTRGTYRVHGERTNANDGLPILNSKPGHTVEGILKVLDSSISGSGEDTDKVVTQVLTMSNRTGGDGHIWVRTGQGANKSSLNWSTWEKLQGIFEKNAVYNLDDIDGYTTNGIYSGLYANTKPSVHGDISFSPGDTFLMIVINGYAATSFGTPQITQLLYKLPAKALNLPQQNAEIYLRTGSYNKTDKVWDWGTFTKMNPTPMISVIYAELVALRDNGELVAGMQYRITDYVTTTAQENTRSAGHQFDVIVTADNKNTLNEVARACLHEGDTYFSEAGANLAAWKIWYCIDNDAERFAWADDENGKGVIYRMIDEWNNDVPYDFKNINFKRYIIEANNAFATNVAKGGEIDIVKAMLQEMSHKIHTDLWYYGEYVSDVYPDANPGTRYVPFGDVEYENEGPQVLCRIDENNYGWFYTFHNEDKDASLLKPNVGEAIGVCDNTIKDSCYVFFVEEGTGSYYPIEIKAQSLNNIVFLGNICYSNIFGNRCYYNSFGSGCSSNTFGASCYSNSFGSGCFSNTFGNSCSSNTFGNNCYNNTFGSDCCKNTFGNSCSSNTFGNSCSSNTFGNNCYNNTFGSGCSNTFGDNCNSNSFGNYCDSSSFGNNCYENTFGNSCSSNTFGNSCSSNTFGNSCSSNTFGNSCSYNSFGNSCSVNTFLNGSDVPAHNIKYCRYDDGVHNVTMNYDASNTYTNIMNIHIYRGVHDVSYTPQADTEVEQSFCCNAAGEIVSFRLVDIVNKVNGL